jgi:light-regulated signal transduction histidine kinase (bacteriophytochrome)
VSHDLRAPLRHVSGFADLLARHAHDKLDDRSRRHLAQISGSAHSMGQLIDDLLAFSRISRLELHGMSVSLDTLVAEVRRELAADVAGRTIDWQVGPLPSVHADGSLLRLVLTNLISNAIKYTARRECAVISITAETTDAEFIVCVRDNGVGFDMAYAHKLFGVFQRLHRAEDFEGTGIGLANVRRIIARHNGRTWAEGALDRGAAFYFSLPRLDGHGDLTVKEAA